VRIPRWRGRWQAGLASFAVALAAPGAGAAADTPPSQGERIYLQSGCFACHGQLGYGGAGPGLRDNKLLLADDYVIGQILLGRGIMPSYADRLDDEQVASVATYIRNSWGNTHGPISAAQVAEGRRNFLAPDDANARGRR
jgi:mono/diheme cytochrome c family protein